MLKYCQFIQKTMNRTDSFILFMTGFLILRMTNSGNKKMRPLHDVR